MRDYLRNNVEEDQGVPTLVTIFMAMLVLIDPLYSIIFMFQSGRALAGMPVAGIIQGLCELGYLFFIFYTCYSFYKKPEKAIKVAKVFLIVRFFYLTASILINFLHYFYDENSIGVRPWQFASVGDMVIKLLLFPLLYVSLFGMWYIVFTKSKTIRGKYHDNANT